MFICQSCGDRLRHGQFEQTIILTIPMHLDSPIYVLAEFYPCTIIIYT